MRLFLISIASFLALALHAQTFNIELVSQTEYPSRGNDVWGFVDSSGVEYGIAGSNAASLIYDLSDPSNPVLVKEVPGAFGTWRDFKHVGNYIYGVADQGSDGVLVIDMSHPQDSMPHAFYRPTYDVGGGIDTVRKIHNLYADHRYVYLSGFDTNNGVMILDTEVDPWQPPVIGYSDHVGSRREDYCHDVYVQDDLMYTSEIYKGIFGVYDISDRSNPVRLVSSDMTTTNFTHNAWASHDGIFLFTTDEKVNANVDAYDISDLGEIRRTDIFQPYRPGAEPTIPHNVHYHEGYLVTSWYEDGVVVIDAHRPDNLIEIASYDSRPEPSSGSFNGCWGAYPYLPSGLLLINDINSGFYVLQPNYTRASYLEGLVIDSLTREPINGANIQIISSQPNIEMSNQMGIFKTGQEAEGSFDVLISHPEYDKKTVNVSISKGIATEIEVELVQSIKTGRIVQEGTIDGIAKGQVAFYNQETGEVVFAEADENGDFAALLDGKATYDVFAGKWGFKGASLSDVAFDNGAPIQLELSMGYEDDFFADLGWTLNSTAETGKWSLGTPNGVQDENGLFVAPGADVDGDLGPSAFVTGNEDGSEIGVDDIDSGETILTSPAMDALGDNVLALQLELNLWYYTCCGNGPLDDEMTISITNGMDTLLIDRISGPGNDWRFWEYELLPIELEFTSDMRVIINASDFGAGNIVEAGIDAFRAETVLLTSLEQIEFTTFSVHPNPVIDLININTGENFSGHIQVFDIVGNRVQEITAEGPRTLVNTSTWMPGVYYVRLLTSETVSQTLSIIKQ